MKRIITSILAVMMTAGFAVAVTIHVPAQYPTIQEGINASSDGDTVLVAAGTYYELIDFSGKEIVVKSESGAANTTIDGGQAGSVVTIDAGEGPGAYIEGFTITNGLSISYGGGGIYCGTGVAPIITGNSIQGNGDLMNFFGGGIYVYHASPTIEYNTIAENECIYFGAGIYLESCDDIEIRWNIIHSNYCWSGYGVATGGGIYAKDSDVLIDHNLICSNIAEPPYGAGGGGIAIQYSGDYQITNNTLAYNESVMWETTGGGIHVSGSATVFAVNNIIVHSQGGGVYSSILDLTLDFNDVWDNLPVDYFGCSAGSFDISEEPLFIGGFPYGYELTSASPCIDAGSFMSALDEDGTRADIGAYAFNQGGVNIAITPDVWPIVIPSSGGSFNYTLRVTNHTIAPVPFDVWVDVRLPDGTIISPLLLREDITFNPEQHAERELTQYVPGNAISGDYYYMAHTGDFAIGEIYHETIMPFSKEGSENTGDDWILDGWDDGSQRLDDSCQPAAFVLYPAYPNPFNATTAINYQLSASSFTKLSVYDIYGRKIYELVNGWRDAGHHEVIFDATDLASGVYIYRLTAGEFTASGKMLLQK